MCLTRCMTSSFQNLLCPSLHHVTCDLCYLTLTLVLKIENRSKMKKENKIKMKRRKIKIKSIFSDLDMNELCIGLTQENSIENSVQDSLPYILKPHGLC